jgi:hypothetical protein
MIATCLICGLTFECRTSYGLCSLCARKDTLRELDRLESAKRHAERMKLSTELNLVQWLAEISDFRGLCAWCQEMPHSEIAMVNPLAGLTWENTAPICRVCSLHKRQGFDTAQRRVQSYLAANCNRTEDDIRLEYDSDEEEIYIPDPLPIFGGLKDG